MTTPRWWNHPVSRRKAVMGAGALGAGLGGLALTGCGDDDDDDDGNGTSSPTSAGTQEPQATPTTSAEEPVAGGTWVSAQTGDIPTIDPYASVNASTKTIAAYTYSRLFEMEATTPNEAGIVPLNPVGDAAESFELSDDGLTYTITLKSNVMFHPPLNRAMTAEDVVFSYQRFMGQLPGSQPATNSTRLSMIESVEAVDPLTVVFTLNRVHAPFIDLLTDTTTLLLMPVETGTAFDPAQRMVGSGPWIMDSYEPGSIITFNRHPEWHGGPERPYLDRLELPTIKEAANRLNQFLSGNLDAYGTAGLDIADIKNAIPDVQHRLTAGSGLVGLTAFSRVNEERPDAPWTDIRVRRALSMAIDRDAILDVAYNVDRINEQGIPMPYNWQGVMAPGFGDFVLSPKDDPDLAQWYSYDPDGAKALLEEAGYGSGFSIDGYSTPQYATLVPTIVELIIQYWRQIGVETTFVSQDYGSEWIPVTFTGEFEGGVAFAGQAGQTDPGASIAYSFGSASQTNQSRVNDPRVEAFLAEYQTALDRDERRQLTLDIQKYLLEQMYYVPSQWGAVPGLTMYQPNVRGIFDHVSFGYSTGQELAYAWKA